MGRLRSKPKPSKTVREILDFDYPNSRSGMSLYDHQRVGANTAGANRSFGIFDEQGLGKTVTAISILNYLFQTGKVGFCLVICYKSAARVWMDHIREWGVWKQEEIDIEPVYDIPSRERHDRIAGVGNHDIAVTTYDLVTRDISEWMSVLKSKPFQNMEYVVILDESQAIKNRKAQRTQACLAVGRLAGYRYILTGTPVPERPEDAWSQVFFLDYGKLFGTYWAFVKQYCVLGNRFSEWAIRGYKKHRLPELAEKLSSVSIRRRKEDCIDLPPKVFECLYVSLGKEDRPCYLQLLSELESVLSNLSNPNALAEIPITAIGGLFTRMLHLTSHVHEKLVVLDHLMGSILPNKLVVWVAFRDTAEFVKEHIKSRCGVVVHTGDMSTEDRSAAIDKFQNDPKCKVFVATIKSCRVAVTLHAASDVVYWDRTFENQDWLQSQDRVHRIGQDHTCTYYSLVTEGTIEEYVSKVLAEKTCWSGELVDGVSTESSSPFTAGRMKWLIDLGRERYGSRLRNNKGETKNG